MHVSLYLSSCYCPITISALLLCTLFLFAGEGHFTPLNMASVELHKFAPLLPHEQAIVLSPLQHHPAVRATFRRHVWHSSELHKLVLLLLHEPGVVLTTLHHHSSDVMRFTFNHHYSILQNSIRLSYCYSMNQPQCSLLSTTTLLIFWGPFSPPCIASLWTPQVCPPASPWTSRSALHSPPPLFWSCECHALMHTPPATSPEPFTIRHPAFKHSAICNRPCLTSVSPSIQGLTRSNRPRNQPSTSPAILVLWSETQTTPPHMMPLEHSNHMSCKYGNWGELANIYKSMKH